MLIAWIYPSLPCPFHRVEESNIVIVRSKEKQFLFLNYVHKSGIIRAIFVFMEMYWTYLYVSSIVYVDL